jgi:hypothetical protein
LKRFAVVSDKPIESVSERSSVCFIGLSTPIQRHLLKDFDIEEEDEEEEEED